MAEDETVDEIQRIGDFTKSLMDELDSSFLSESTSPIPLPRIRSDDDDDADDMESLAEAGRRLMMEIGAMPVFSRTADPGRSPIPTTPSGPSQKSNVEEFMRALQGDMMDSMEQIDVLLAPVSKQLLPSSAPSSPSKLPPPLAQTTTSDKRTPSKSPLIAQIAQSDIADNKTMEVKPGADLADMTAAASETNTHRPPTNETLAPSITLQQQGSVSQPSQPDTTLGSPLTSWLDAWDDEIREEGAVLKGLLHTPRSDHVEVARKNTSREAAIGTPTAGIAGSDSVLSQQAARLVSPTSAATEVDSIPYSETNRNAPGAKPVYEIDPRIRGDFNVWHKGSRLTSEGIHAAYTGIHTPPLTDTASKCFTSHVIECVIRPDVELRGIMAIVFQACQHHGLLFETHEQRSHALIAHSQSIYNRHGDGTAENAGQSASHLGVDWGSEWDCIDVQVCLSRELRQRALVLQVLHIPSIFTAAHVIPASIESYPLTYNLINTLQYLLCKKGAALSCLYATSPGDVCQCSGPPLGRGLDSTLLAQSITFCKESMWKALKDASDSLDEYLHSVQRRTAEMMAAVEPVYKQHGICLPPIPVRDIFDPTTLALPNWDDYDAEPEPEDEDDHVSSLPVSLVSMLTVIDKGSSDGCSRARTSSGHPHEDSMSICLRAMSEMFTCIKNKCDKEFSARLQAKNKLVVSYGEALLRYKSQLLHVLADQTEAQYRAWAIKDSVRKANLGAAASSSTVSISGASAASIGRRVEGDAAKGTQPPSKLQHAFSLIFHDVHAALPARPLDFDDHNNDGESARGLEAPAVDAGLAGLEPGTGEVNQEVEQEQKEGTLRQLLSLASSSDEYKIDSRGIEGLDRLDGESDSISSASTDYGEGAEECVEELAYPYNNPEMASAVSMPVVGDGHSGLAVQGLLRWAGEMLSPTKPASSQPPAPDSGPAAASVSKADSTLLGMASTWLATLSPPPRSVSKQPQPYAQSALTPRPSPRLSSTPMPKDSAVLFYAACLVGPSPGTVYVTPYHVCLAHGSLNPVREAYPLKSMDTCTSSGDNDEAEQGGYHRVLRGRESSITSKSPVGAFLASGLALMGRPTLTMGFFASTVVLTVTPLAVSCAQLRSVILDAKIAFRDRPPPPPVAPIVPAERAARTAESLAKVSAVADASDSHSGSSSTIAGLTELSDSQSGVRNPVSGNIREGQSKQSKAKAKKPKGRGSAKNGMHADADASSSCPNLDTSARDLL